MNGRSWTTTQVFEIMHHFMEHSVSATWSSLTTSAVCFAAWKQWHFSCQVSSASSDYWCGWWVSTTKSSAVPVIATHPIPTCLTGRQMGRITTNRHYSCDGWMNALLHVFPSQSHVQSRSVTIQRTPPAIRSEFSWFIHPAHRPLIATLFADQA